jgi:catechol 2,3-dioxygenase-like lactoylglutathione lyase family enzyme
MTTKPVLDHLALAVPNLDQLVKRLTGAFGMVVEQQFDGFAVLVDPGSGLKFRAGRIRRRRRALPAPWLPGG